MKSASSAKTRFGRTGWSVSTVGFGAYRVEDSDPSHRLALRQALEAGCNLIDTSTNYTNGSSERAIGSVLAETLEAGSLRREEIFVISKVGYLQGRNLELAQEREAGGEAFPEMVRFRDDIWHCISPEFIADQITRSLARLRLGYLDAMLLHNPEYFLKAGGTHEEYYRRIQAAFKHLEAEIARGRIRRYGVSSNTFVEPKDAPDYTSLETVIGLAGPGFAVIQFPMNLLEPGALFEPNNSGKSVIELAREHDLATLVNRPLNAFAGERMIRLADFPSHADRDVEEDLKDAFLPVLQLEAKYPAREKVPARSVCWGHALRDGFERLTELDFWKQVLRYQIQPKLSEGYSRLLEAGGEPARWAEEHSGKLEALFRAQTRFLEARHAAESARIKSAIERGSPTLRSARQTLSQESIRVYRSVPGIHSVLVGMRQPEYVRDAMGSLEPIPESEAIAALESAIEASR